MKEMRPDRDPRRLTQLLRSSVPDSPDPTGRAARVVRRTGQANRRRGAAAAFTVGVAAAAVIVTPHFVGGSPVTTATGPHVSGRSTTATGPAQYSPPVTAPDSYECPAPGHPPRAAESVRTGKVPLGAVLARICDTGGEGTVAWQAPLDPLTANVDAVARAFNSAPRGRPLPCPAPMNGHGFSMTFQYADGHLVRVSGDADVPCDFANLHGTPGLGRFASTQVMKAYLTELANQRSQQTPPPSVPELRLSCPSSGDNMSARLATGVNMHSLLPTGRTLNLTQAIVCSYDPYQGRADRVAQQGRFTAAQVSAINSSYAQRVTHPAPPGATCMNPVPPDIDIVGENVWGDIVELRTSCYVYTPVVGSPPQLWWPPTDREWKMIYTVLRPT